MKQTKDPKKVIYELKEWLDAKDIAEANLERQREKRGEEE